MNNDENEQNQQKKISLIGNSLLLLSIMLQLILLKLILVYNNKFREESFHFLQFFHELLSQTYTGAK